MEDLLSLIKKSGIPEKELIQHLPESLKELSGHLRFTDMLFLIERIGGVKVVVPKALNGDSFLVQRLGREKAEMLIRVCRGENFYMPKAISLENRLKNEIIFQLCKQGLITNEIALKLNLSDRTVQNVKRRGTLQHECK